MKKWAKKGPKGPFLAYFLDLVEPILGVKTSNLIQIISKYQEYHKNIIRYGEGALN